MSKELNVKIKPIRKGWVIDLSKIEEGYLYEEKTVSTNTINEAKTKLLNEFKYEGLSVLGGEELTYLNIPVIRHKGSDVFLFEGKEKTFSQITKLLEEKEREEELDKILKDNSIKYCYITKRGYHYKSNMMGYTDFRIFAGTYLKEIAVNHAKSVREVVLIPIDIVEHNELINNHINEFKSRLLE